jgi:hypothetical protein
VQQQTSDRYKNILVIVVGFSLLAWIFKFVTPEWKIIVWKTMILLGLFCLMIPPLAKAVEWAWLKLALGLGWINSRIILSIVYFVFLMPIAWLAKLFTKDPLMLKRKDASSLYVTRDHEYNKQDLENIW